LLGLALYNLAFLLEVAGYLMLILSKQVPGYVFEVVESLILALANFFLFSLNDLSYLAIGQHLLGDLVPLVVDGVDLLDQKVRSQVI
jgi:hypothetical protein